MPNAPRRRCSRPNCPNFQPCTTHKPKQRSARSEAYHALYDARWRRARLAYLAEHPLCVDCEREGRLTPATQVDHIIPHKGDLDLLWASETNWQGLCVTHHSRKTMFELNGVKA